MRIEDKVVLELCKKNYNSDTIEAMVLDQKFKFDYLDTIIDKHMIRPFILNEMARLSLPGPLKEKIIAAAKGQILEITLRNRMIKKEFARLKSILDENGIECILMKGLSLDYSGLRTIGDLDILLREKDFIKADGLARSAGFEYVGDILNPLLKKNEKSDIALQLGWNNQFQYYNKKNSLLLELHTNLFERERAYDIDLDVLLSGISLFWDNRVWREDLGAYVFSDEDQLILMCLHTAVKRSLSANMFIMRNLIDIRNLAGRRIDWGALSSLSERLNISSLVLFSLTLAVRLIEAAVPGETLARLGSVTTKGQRLLIAIHLKCFYNLESSSLLYPKLFEILCPFVFQKKWLPRIKALLMVYIIFPSRAHMARTYHLRKNNPLIVFTYLLNPFRLIYLLLKRIFG